MIRKTRPLCHTAAALLSLLVLFTALLPQTAWADHEVREDTIELTGRFSGQFELTSSDVSIFALENMVPGDSWEGRLKVVNKTGGEMHMSLISITSNLEDNVLYDALDLKILLDGGLLYNGPYSGTRTPMVEWLEVPANQDVVFEIFVSLPTTADNEVQGRKMDSTWLFEAYFEKGDNVQTGVDLTVGNSGNATWLIISGLCLTCGLILFFRVKSVKRTLQYSTEKEEHTHEE